MQRIPEPELMTTQEQVDAYADADFSSGDSRTVALVEQLLDETGPLPKDPLIVDLGCGHSRGRQSEDPLAADLSHPAIVQPRQPFWNHHC